MEEYGKTIILAVDYFKTILNLALWTYFSSGIHWIFSFYRSVSTFLFVPMYSVSEVSDEDISSFKWSHVYSLDKKACCISWTFPFCNQSRCIEKSNHSSQANHIASVWEIYSFGLLNHKLLL